MTNKTIKSNPGYDDDINLSRNIDSIFFKLIINSGVPAVSTPFHTIYFQWGCYAVSKR